ncbi:MAG: hypothetical protein QXF59_04815 [Candidatus Bathyarchaeia archaeon]|nr:hypothetical protein [Candidatus Bathyarchaeota archaeon]
MPKAGKYEYPAYDLDTCIERLKKIYEVSKSSIVKKETAAEIIGMSPKSGATLSFFASLAMYGLIEYRDGNVEITDLAKRILFGSSDEAALAKREAVRKIQIFIDLFSQYGANVTEEQLRVFLRDRASVDLPRIPELVGEIGRVYRKVSPYLMLVEQPKAPAPAEVAEKKEAAAPEVTEARIPEVLRIQYGSFINIAIPMDRLDILEAYYPTIKTTFECILRDVERKLSVKEKTAG